MRLYTVIAAVLAVVLLTQAGVLQSGPGKDVSAQRIARLIKQLGHAEFAKRQAASKELEAIGAPALDALRAAAAGGDPEIRGRAERIIQAITGPMRAAAAKKELAKLQGAWALVSAERDGIVFPYKDKTHTMTFTGQKWVYRADGIPFEGTLQLVDVAKEPKSWDFTNTTAGVTGYGIYRIDGDSGIL